MIRFGSHFESRPQRASLHFPRGLGLVAAQEIQALLEDAYTPHAFPVRLEAMTQQVLLENASLRTLAESCLRATTVKDIIWHLGDARVVFEHELAKALGKVPWREILPEGGGLHLKTSTAESRLYHSGLIAERAAKCLGGAGVEAVERGEAVTTLELTLRRDRLSLGLSLAGAPLNRRSFRQGLSHCAPLNECLAAAVLRFAEKAAVDCLPALQTVLPEIDVPFAGSGTFGFEALLRFGRIAPCVLRGSYAVERLRCVPQKSLRHTRHKACQSIISDGVHIRFTEIDPELCLLLRSYSDALLSQLEALGVRRPVIEVEEGDFFSSSRTPDSGLPLCLLLNPPYGERLPAGSRFFSALGEKTVELYGSRRAPVWGAALIPSGQPSTAFEAALGRRILRKAAVRNGGIPVQAIAFLMQRHDSARHFGSV